MDFLASKVTSSGGPVEVPGFGLQCVRRCLCSGDAEGSLGIYLGCLVFPHAPKLSNKLIISPLLLKLVREDMPFCAAVLKAGERAAGPSPLFQYRRGTGDSCCGGDFRLVHRSVWTQRGLWVEWQGEYSILCIFRGI